MNPAVRDRYIRWAIVCLLVLNACWVFLPSYFITMDGWAHLQIARMLMAGPDGHVFCQNPGTVPNQTAYWILGALQTIMPALVAERVLLALIVLGLGLGTWMLMRAHGEGNALALLVLPFTYNFLLVLGFQNFLLGVALALVFGALWVRMERLRWTAVVLFVLASFLLFYTHPMAVALFFLLCGGHELAVLSRVADRDRTGPLGKPWVALPVLLLACVPAVIAILRFNASQKGFAVDVDRALNLRELIDLRSLTWFGGPEEQKFTYAMKLILVGAGLLAVVHRSLRTDGARLRVERGDTLLALTVIVLAAYFLLPDSNGYASYITVRLQLIGLLLFIA
ncbi:MAG TPA: hypothetical protein VKG92_12110, partial [Flavobacteriales bacterium]|nr:hypothetical protein [Flavobacteriales bacterium]